MWRVLVPNISKCLALFLTLKLCALPTGVAAQELKLSNSVSTHICGQQKKFQESSSIQEPAKERPENDDAKCGWLLWTKCDDENKPDSECPNFTFEPCGEEPKKGRSTGAKAKPMDDEICPLPLEFPGLEDVTPPNKYPQLVAIHRGIGCYIRACWGAIINEEWVVVPQTSGCFASFAPSQPEDFHIIAGDRVVYVDEGTEQKRKIAEFIPHPDFNYYAYKHYRANLGLVRLEEPFEFNDDVQPMDLNLLKEISSSSGAPLENLTVASWLGYRNETNISRLIEFPVDFVPDSDCYNKFMEEDGASNGSLICAGNCLVTGQNFEAGPKQGFLFTWRESSDPAAGVKGKVPVPVGIGPVNHATSKKNGPFGVFTDLSFYIPWIEETINKTKGKKKVQGRSGSGSGAGGSGRLSGSSDVPPHKYPSMMNLWKNENSQCMQHSCGGLILSSQWVMTAAHCVQNPPEEYKVIVGDHDQSKPEGTEQELKVEKIIQHELWGKTQQIYDIAVLKVSPPIQMNDNVQPVKLPEQNFETEVSPLQAVGWGLHLGYFPHILQEVEFPIIEYEECVRLMKEAKGRAPDKEKHICGGSTKVIQCPGDSGGPLYLINEAGEQTVLGLSNYGPAIGLDLCDYFKFGGARADTSDEKLYPSVYTKVSAYIDWIHNNSDFS